MKKSPRWGFFHGAPGGDRTHNLQRRRLTRYPIAPRVHRISSCKAAGILRAKGRCRFFGLCSAFVLRSCDAFGVGRPHNLQRRRLTRYPIAPRVHIQFLCPPGILRAKERCRFFGLCSALVRRLRRRAPPRPSASERYPIAPRVHIKFLCPPGLLRGFAARATASGGANPDRRRRRPLCDSARGS